MMIWLPYPQSVNHYKTLGAIRKTKSGKLYQPRINSRATMTYYRDVSLIMKAQGVKSFRSDTISLEIHVYPPDKRKRDLDGILKVLLDAMQRGGLYDDDYQIDKLLVIRCSPVAKGEVRVIIKKIDSKGNDDEKQHNDPSWRNTNNTES